MDIDKSFGHGTYGHISLSKKNSAISCRSIRDMKLSRLLFVKRFLRIYVKHDKFSLMDFRMGLMQWNKRFVVDKEAYEGEKENTESLERYLRICKILWDK